MNGADTSVLSPQKATSHRECSATVSGWSSRDNTVKHENGSALSEGHAQEASDSTSRSYLHGYECRNGAAGDHLAELNDSKQMLMSSNSKPSGRTTMEREWQISESASCSARKGSSPARKPSRIGFKQKFKGAGDMGRQCQSSSAGNRPRKGASKLSAGCRWEQNSFSGKASCGHKDNDSIIGAGGKPKRRMTKTKLIRRSWSSSSTYSEVFELDAAVNSIEINAVETEKESRSPDFAVSQCTPEWLINETHSAVTKTEASHTSNGDQQWGPSVMDILSEEIWDCHMKLAQTEIVLNRKLHLRDCLYYAICSTFPVCGLYIVGSSLNGFGTNSSDMDLCLMITDKELDQRSEAFVVLSKVRNKLEEKSWILEQMLIPAKVPILRIRFNEPFEDITVDLNANNTVAIRNTHLLSYYSGFDWRVPPLVSVVKEWAKRRDINDANRSSFTSYSLVLMVVHYLQCGVNPPILPSLQELYSDRFSGDTDVRLLDFSKRLEQPLPDEWQLNESSTLGELLLGFLEYYAFKFDYLHDAISVRLGRKVGRAFVARQRSPFSSSYNANIAQWSCICIEEPFTLMNTAHSVHNQMVFDAIRQAFVDSYKELEANCDLKTFFAGPPICYHLSVPRKSSNPVNTLTYAQVVASPPKSASRSSASASVSEEHAEFQVNLATTSHLNQAAGTNMVSKGLTVSRSQTAHNLDSAFRDQQPSEGILAYCVKDAECCVSLLNSTETQFDKSCRVGEAESSLHKSSQASAAGRAQSATSGPGKVRLNAKDALSKKEALRDLRQGAVSRPATPPLPVPKPVAPLRCDQDRRVRSAGSSTYTNVCAHRGRRKA